MTLAFGRRGRWLIGSPLLSLALASAMDGDAIVAARLLGAADAVLHPAGLDNPAHVQHRVDRASVLAREALGDAAFTRMWEAGRADPAAVIATALDPADAHGSGDGESVYGLTRRERDVLRLLADGRTDREIARAIFVTRRTASKHVSAILAKLDVDTRTAAVATALRRGLL